MKQIMLNYITMSKKVYIGCGAGFAGDRYDASIPIVEDFKSINEPKYLMFEVLAERTLLLSHSNIELMMHLKDILHIWIIT